MDSSRLHHAPPTKEASVSDSTSPRKKNQALSSPIIFKNGEPWTEIRVRDFLLGIRAAMKVDSPFPIDLDDIWEFGYSRFKDAERGMIRLDFKEGEHYQTHQRMSGVNSAPAAAKIKGRPGKRVMLSVPAAEHLMIEKVPAIREVYRRVFHEWFDDQEIQNEKSRRLEARAKGIQARKKLCSVAQDQGLRGRGFELMTQQTYLGLFGKNKKGLLEEYGVATNETPRNFMSSQRISYVDTTEETTASIIESQDIRGNVEIPRVAFEVASEIRDSIVKILNKPRKSF